MCTSVSKEQRAWVRVLQLCSCSRVLFYSYSKTPVVVWYFYEYEHEYYNAEPTYEWRQETPHVHY